jgi:hypothetical protein
MRRIAAHLFAAAAFALLPSAALAQDDITSLRSEVDALRREINTGMATGYDDRKPVPATAPAGGDASHHCGCDHGCGCNTCCNCCNTCCQQYCYEQGTCGCFEPCCHSSGLWASAELLWFRYHRADGVRVGVEANEQAEFDFEITPRLTAGWVRNDGLGIRARWWEFVHRQDAVEGGGSAVDVDTYTFDVELFDTFCLNRNWDLEIAGGIRTCEFDEVLLDIPGDNEVRVNNFTGFGVVTSAELRRVIGQNGNIWVRGRSAILMDDKDIFNTSGDQQELLLDVTVGMTELAIGYDYVAPLQNGAYAFVGVQAEWQNWYNFSSGFEDTANNEDFAGPADVGFGGFGVRVGVAR